MLLISFNFENIERKKENNMLIFDLNLCKTVTTFLFDDIDIPKVLIFPNPMIYNIAI